MVDINCIVCKKPIKIPSYIDPDDYDGQLFCHNCNLLLYVRLKLSKVKKYKVVEKQPKVKPNIQVISGVPRPDYSTESEGELKELKESQRGAKPQI